MHNTLMCTLYTMHIIIFVFLRSHLCHFSNYSSRRVACGQTTNKDAYLRLPTNHHPIPAINNPQPPASKQQHKKTAFHNDSSNSLFLSKKFLTTMCLRHIMREIYTYLNCFLTRSPKNVRTYRMSYFLNNEVISNKTTSTTKFLPNPLVSLHTPHHHHHHHHPSFRRLSQIKINHPVRQPSSHVVSTPKWSQTLVRTVHTYSNAHRAVSIILRAQTENVSHRRSREGRKGDNRDIWPLVNAGVLGATLPDTPLTRRLFPIMRRPQTGFSRPNRSELHLMEDTCTYIRD